jgi:uncharacterized protein
MPMIRPILALTAAAAIAFSGTLPASAEMPAPEKQFLSIGTSSAGGTFFPMASAMAGVIGKYYPQLRINPEITGGSVDNVRLIAGDKLEMALASAMPVYQGYRGLEGFKDNKADMVRGIMVGHGSVWQAYTLKKYGIKSIADLKGKRVSLGAPGSDNNVIGREVIESYGLKMNDDWKPEYIGHSDGPGALRDGRVDAVMIVTGVPSGPITDITATSGADVVFLTPDSATIGKLAAAKPFYARMTVPGGTYNGHPDDIETFGMPSALIAHEKVSEPTVYAITKALIEHHDELVAANALGRHWRKEGVIEAVTGMVPLHPGAEAYYREIGLIK